MVEVLAVLGRFFAGLLALPVPGIGIPYGVLALGLIALSSLLWCLKNMIGGD